MSSLVLLRPWWLLALLPLALLWWWRRRSGGAQAGNWQQAVDAHLLPHLLVNAAAAAPAGARWPRWLLPVLGVLAVLALAGPSWREIDVPLSQTEAPLVLAVDLSSGSRASDLKPSRLAQVRAKLKQLVAAREGGQLGLVVFADDAFGAAPITRDAHTLDNLLDALSPDVMPADGHRPDRAIAVAVAQMQQAGFRRGDVLLLTDHADDRALAAARTAAGAGFRTSVLGVGTATGAPLATRSGFVTDAQGQVQLARLDADSLSALAVAGGGNYALLARDERDLRALGLLDATGSATEVDTGNPLHRSRQRSDDGYWLLPALLLLAALAWWRRPERAVWAVWLGLGALICQPPGPAQAQPAEPPAAATTPAAPPPAVARSWWQALWQRPDQQARAALDAGDLATAQALATEPAVQGAAAFRAGDYARAAQAYEQQPDDPEALYNRGTALAAGGEYEAALKALEGAITRAPDHADAIANRQAILDFLERQRQQQQQQQGDGQQGDPQQQQGDSQQQQSEAAQDGQQQQQGEGDAGQPGEPGSAGAPESGKPPEDPGAAADPAAEPGADGEPQATTARPDAGEPSAHEQQQAAAAAQKQAMQEALAAQQAADPEGARATAAPLSAEQRIAAEQQQALEQWLRRVPDDPGALLRRKFALEQQRRAQEQARGERTEIPP